MRFEVKQPYKIKLAILYIAAEFAEPVSDILLTEIALDICNIDYFNLKQALYELRMDEFIETYVDQNTEYHLVSAKGREASQFFLARLSFAMRHEITAHIKNLKVIRDKRNGFVCNVVGAPGGGFNVRCAYEQGDDVTFELVFRAGDYEQSKKIADELAKKQDIIYSDIYNYLIHITHPEEATDQSE